MAIKVVLCDVDGVIRHWDGDPVAAAEREHGLQEGAIARVMFARELLYPACVGQITTEKWAEQGRDRLIESGLGREVAAAVVHAHLSNTFSIDQRVMDWLVAVRARLPVWLFTNQMDEFNETMADTGVLERVDGVINSAEVGAAKPDAEIYRIAAGMAGVEVEECLFIDDRSENTAAAAELGMATVLYRSFEDLDGVLD